MSKQSWHWEAARKDNERYLFTARHASRHQPDTAMVRKGKLQRCNALSVLASSHCQRASSVITLARNLYFFGSRFFTGLTAVFITCLHEAPAWYMRAIDWLIRGHPTSPCPSIFCFFLIFAWSDCGGCYLLATAEIYIAMVQIRPRRTRITTIKSARPRPPVGA
jgi:hypothetical protein